MSVLSVSQDWLMLVCSWYMFLAISLMLFVISRSKTLILSLVVMQFVFSLLAYVKTKLILKFDLISECPVISKVLVSMVFL